MVETKTFVEVLDNANKVLSYNIWTTIDREFEVIFFNALFSWIESSVDASQAITFCFLINLLIFLW